MLSVAQNHRKALVVLGCRVRHRRPGGALLRRLRCAQTVQREFQADVVIMSGGKTWNGVVEAEVMARWWEDVVGAKPRAEIRSLTTRQNALEVATILRDEGIDEVGLVTCDFHMPRAAGHFSRLGFPVVEFGADSGHSLGRRLRLAVREWGARKLEVWEARLYPSRESHR